MRVWVEHDSKANAFTIKHKGVDLQSEEDIQKWRSMVLSELAKAVPKDQKVWLLVDFDGFRIGPGLADRYGEVAKEVRAFAKDVIRYNCEGIFTTTSVRTKAITYGYSSRICHDRQEALKLLHELKKGNRGS